MEIEAARLLWQKAAWLLMKKNDGGGPVGDEQVLCCRYGQPGCCQCCSDFGGCTAFAATIRRENDAGRPKYCRYLKVRRKCSALSSAKVYWLKQMLRLITKICIV